MAQHITGASPMMIGYGTDDQSRRPIPITEQPIPQHLPKVYFYGQKGRGSINVTSGSHRDTLYGTESFNLNGKYANHATVYINGINAEGNICSYERIIPDDATIAEVTLCLHVLSTDVDQYQRNADGTYQLNAVTGLPVVDSGAGQIPGYKLTWSHEYGLPWGAATTTASTLLPGGTRYPIKQFRASSEGEFGNNRGISLHPIMGDKVPTELVRHNLAFINQLSVYKRKDELSTKKSVNTIFGSVSMPFSYKRDAVDPTTNKSVEIENTFLPMYENTTDPKYTLSYADIGGIKVYTDNIDIVITLLHTAEAPHVDQFSDFSNDANDKYLINILTGQNSNRVPYNSIVFEASAGSVLMSEHTTIWLSGGSDGTMSDAAFDASVSAKMEEYINPDSILLDTALNVESVFYDSGFGMDTKLDLANFIGLRQDTMPILCTHIHGEDQIENNVELSRAIVLRTRLQNYPESTYFGTPTMRGMVVGQTGIIRSSVWTKRVPLSYEIAVKAARYMGAANGSWKNGLGFDGAPGSVISEMYDIQKPFIPSSVRIRYWDAGLVWAQPFGIERFFFPALKTVYPDDTSVLNSMSTVFAIMEINKVSWKCWREFSGVSYLTNAQLLERVEAFMRDNLEGRFDNRFNIESTAYISEADDIRGYSWTLNNVIYASNMKTVMATYVTAHRNEDPTT